MLEYERDILQEITAEGTLVIPALGINMQRVFKQFLSLYDDNRGILIALNAGRYEHKLLGEMGLRYSTNISKLPVSQRKIAYEGGGIFYGSSRIFIADFLNKVVDKGKISAIVVFNVEQLHADGRDAFILYMFRKNNNPGLVTAFVNDPIKLQSQSLSKIRSYTQTSQVSLYPRFHEKLVQSFPDLSAAKVYIRQSSMIEEISLLLSDLVKGTFKLRYPGMGPNTCDSILIRYANCRELQDFKDLFSILFTCDSLSFYVYYKRILERKLRSNEQDTWAHTPTSCILAEKAQEYLESDIKRGFANLGYPAEKRIRREVEEEYSPGSPKGHSEMQGVDERGVFEYLISQPFLDDIPSEMDFLSTESESGSNDSTHEATTGGPFSTACLSDGNSIGEVEGIPDACSEEVSGASPLSKGLFKMYYTANSKIKKVVEIIMANKDSRIACVLPNIAAKPIFSNIMGFVVENISVKVCTRREFDENDARETEIVIMPSPDLATIRQIESMASCNLGLRIFILMIKDSLEEQLYLLEMKEERCVFERFIEEKVVLPLANPQPEPLDIGDDGETEYEITVDSREMMARLPFYLYRAGNILNVRTLKIGDYIIGTRCIERKTVEDLRGSLNSGRLYSQARRMAHAYDTPILLIEFEEGIPALLPYEITSTFSKSLIAKLCLFLVNFNTFQILWSNSNLFSVEVIRDMQRRGCSEREQSTGVDPTLYEILLCIPGINSFNVRNILREYKSLKEVATSTLGKLESVLKDKERSKKVYNFFRDEF